MSTSRRAGWGWPAMLFVLAATMVAPLLFMLFTALRPPGSALGGDGWTDGLRPSRWRWDNFATAWTLIPFGRFYLNSLAVALAVTAGQVFTSACAAFAFSRLSWRGRDVCFALYVGTMMVPVAVTMLPSFVALALLPDFLQRAMPAVDWLAHRVLGYASGDPSVGRLVGIDSYFALIVPVMFSAYGTFMLRQFFLGLPRELDEAAELDGAGPWRIFLRITLPLSLPGLATLSLFTFVGTWGSFLWPLIVTNDPQLSTLPLGLLAFQNAGTLGTEWPLLMAAGLMMLLPVIGVFLVGQRYFVAGLLAGGVKG